jgi:hypothetical protein
MGRSNEAPHNSSHDECANNIAGPNMNRQWVFGDIGNRKAHD